MRVPSEASGRLSDGVGVHRPYEYAELDLTLDRHEVTLVELTPVVDETPPWWDDSRLLGLGEGSR
ncbi:hypothetical protein [Nonomuraea sp. NPDC049784]|uniref:hypothetical protein n=1 Tax=Nonomuraea sp. NPDC049784 TaxID=3154361 RepID=UPI0033E8E692